MRARKNPGAPPMQRPVALGGEADWLGDVGLAEPTALERVVGPERQVDIVSMHAGVGDECLRVGEESGFHEGFREAGDKLLADETADHAASIEGAVFSEAGGSSFVVPGSGRDLDGSFTGHPVTGDFSLTTRLLDWHGPVGMMGLTVRVEGEDKERAMAVTLGEVGGRLARLRTRDGEGKVVTQRGCDFTWLPVWFRLQRAGNEFTAYQSSGGIEWFVVGKSDVSLPDRVLASLLVSQGRTPPGRKETDSPRGIFDQVVVEPQLPDAPTVLVATYRGHGVVRLEWKNPAHGATASGVKIEASRDGPPFHEIADLTAGAIRFESTGIHTPSTIRDRIRNSTTGCYSAYSGIAP